MTNTTHTTGDIPEGFEPAEVAHAKNIVLGELHDLADNAMIELGGSDGEVDAIGWAEAIVERLIAHGLEIPEAWASRPSKSAYHPTFTDPGNPEDA